MIDVKRSDAPPASLATQKSYAGHDVKHRLEVDFHGKCYLCEGALSGTFQVEHLVPVTVDASLKFEWTNLFPAHGDRCNQRRLKYPEAGLLNPSVEPRAEARLRQSLDLKVGALGVDVHFLPVRPDDAAATNTAAELNHIHNNDDTYGHAQGIRQGIASQWTHVQRALVSAHAHRVEFGEQSIEFREARERFLRLIDRDAPYAGLIRTKINEEMWQPKVRALFDLDARLARPL